MMHMNTYGLMMNGFRMVASYEAFTKGQRKLNVECYTNGTEYLVRSFFSGKTAWDDIFTDKDEANRKVKYLLNLRDWHKRIF